MPKFKPFNKGRVFVVDEPIVASTIAAILLRRDFAVSTYTDGMKALRAARTESPDLLITDLEISQFAGIDLALRLRKRCPTCKVLFFSGRPGTTHPLKIARSSGLEFELIPKPVDPQELVKKVQDLMEAASRAAATARALKTYNNNVQETLSRLKSDSPFHFSE